jgi:hypothetical protein
MFCRFLESIFHNIKTKLYSMVQQEEEEIFLQEHLNVNKQRTMIDNRVTGAEY